MFSIREKDQNASARADINCEAARWLAGHQDMRTVGGPNSSPFKR